LIRVLAAVLVPMVVLAVTVVLYLGVSAYTPALTDGDGIAIPESIAVLEKVELGGLDQWILIRGADRSNPVLLWLHGGPGGAQMPFAHHVDRPLEEHFVVVHWDQRGAGKSNHGAFDENTMSVERYLTDAEQLIAHLRSRLEVDRIVLLGHSWGTRLGIELVNMHPDLFHAYIAVGQVVNHDRATEIARDWLLRVIDPLEAPEDWRTLREIEFPARRHSDYRALNQLTYAYSGSLDLSFTQLARIAIQAPEYTFLDYFRLVQGMDRGGRPMHPGGIIESYNFIESIPEIQVPIYFFNGVRDYNTPLALVEEYYAAIDAPHKQIVRFENSAHLPFFAESAKFAAEVIRIAEQPLGAAPARVPEF
jgi:pimeloyl-ACP methyl ester carboxylesterase